MTLRMVKISLLSLLISLPGAVFAQDNLDSFPVQSKKEYDDFVEKSKADFNNFSSKARQDYKDFASRISQQIQKTKEQKSANLPQEQRAETTRFKIPVFSQTTGETYFLSPMAVNVYTETDSLDSFVKVTVYDGEVYVLPEEKESYPIWYETEKKKLEGSAAQAVTGESPAPFNQDHLCPSNTPECEDLLVLWTYMRMPKENFPALVNGAREQGFAAALRKDKRLCIGGAYSGALTKLEKHQRERLLGENFNLAALEDFMWRGEFTKSGWEETFHSFCLNGRSGKLDKAQLKQIKKFAKQTERALEAKKIPLIRLNNRDPFASSWSKFYGALTCIGEL